MQGSQSHGGAGQQVQVQLQVLGEYRSGSATAAHYVDCLAVLATSRLRGIKQPLGWSVRQIHHLLGPPIRIQPRSRRDLSYKISDHPTVLVVAFL